MRGLWTKRAGIDWADVVFDRGQERKVFTYLGMFHRSSVVSPLSGMRVEDPQAFVDLLERLCLLDPHANATEHLEALKKKHPFPWTQSTIATINKELDEELRTWIGIPTSALLRIQSRWGTVVPITTLLARLHRHHLSGTEGVRTIGLAKILAQSIGEGWFDTLKFGDPICGLESLNLPTTSKRQLEFLTKEQVAQWSQERHEIMLLGPKQSVNQPQPGRQRAIRSFLEESLIPKLIAYQQEYGEAPAVAKIVLTNDACPPQDALAALHAAFGNNSRQVVGFLADTLTQSNDARLLKWCGRLLQVLFGPADNHGLGVDAHSQKGIQNDVRVLLQEHLKTAAKEMVLSVLTHDPYALLTVGTAVDATSCLALGTGGNFHLALAETVDACRQVILSFAIKPECFESSHDFHRIAYAVFDGDKINVSYDGATRTAVFNIGAETIKCQLGRAFKRNLIRIGKTHRGTPGILAEKTYEPLNYPLAEIARENQINLIEQAANAVRATSNMEIGVAATKSPVGGWSDSGRCRSSGPFSVLPKQMV